MTPHTLEVTTLVDPGDSPVVQFMITMSPGSKAEVTVNSALAPPAHGNQEPLVSDADEFTSVPSAVVPVDGAGNGHTTLVG
jgi:hypothetical protein